MTQCCAKCPLPKPVLSLPRNPSYWLRPPLPQSAKSFWILHQQSSPCQKLLTRVIYRKRTESQPQPAGMAGPFTRTISCFAIQGVTLTISQGTRYSPRRRSRKVLPPGWARISPMQPATSKTSFRISFSDPRSSTGIRTTRSEKVVNEAYYGPWEISSRTWAAP